MPPAVQDAWVIHEGLGGQNNLMLAVFDGHGQEGDKVSRQVAATLPGLMANSSAFRVRGSPCSRTYQSNGKGIVGPGVSLR